MREKIVKFLKLPGSQKRLFCEAFVTLGVMRLGILTVSFKRLTRSLRHSGGEVIPSALPTHSLQTAQRMLQRRNVAGVFYLGIMRDEDAKERMKAHAWAKCGDLVVTGKGYEGFAVLSSFRWEGK